MDAPKNSPFHDWSSEDELRPIDVVLEALERLKSGLSRMECAVCMYETEFKHSEDPYDNRVHPFKQQFQNTSKGIGELILNVDIENYIILHNIENNCIVQIEDNFSECITTQNL